MTSEDAFEKKQPIIQIVINKNNTQGFNQSRFSSEEIR